VSATNKDGIPTIAYASPKRKRRDATLLIHSHSASELPGSMPDHSTSLLAPSWDEYDEETINMTSEVPNFHEMHPPGTVKKVKRRDRNQDVSGNTVKPSQVSFASSKGDSPSDRIRTQEKSNGKQGRRSSHTNTTRSTLTSSIPRTDHPASFRPSNDASSSNLATFFSPMSQKASIPLPQTPSNRAFHRVSSKTEHSTQSKRCFTGPSVTPTRPPQSLRIAADANFPTNDYPETVSKQPMSAVAKDHLKTGGTKSFIGSKYINIEDNASSPPSTPFRFTSFPASLPRVNNPRVLAPLPVEPLKSAHLFASPTPVNSRRVDDKVNNVDEVRKHMLFSEPTSPQPSKDYGDSTNNLSNPQTSEKFRMADNVASEGFAKSVRNSYASLKSSHSDKMMQNSSTGCISVDQQNNPFEAKAVTGTPQVRSHKQWNYPGDMNLRDKDDGIQDQSFESEVENDETATSPLHGDATQLGRTRLLFSSPSSPEGFVANVGKEHNEKDPTKENDTTTVLDPTKIVKCAAVQASHDLAEGYDQNRTSSFPSSHTSFWNKDASIDDTATTATASTPFLFGSGDGHRWSSRHGERTPREVQIHFPIDTTQCSPIPGDPDENVCESHVMSAPAFPMGLSGGPEILGKSNNILKNEIPSEIRSTTWNEMENPTDQATLTSNDFCLGMNSVGSSAPKDDLVVYNLDENTSSGAIAFHLSTTSNSTMSGSRKSRPMPDMSAFDGGTSEISDSFTQLDRSGVRQITVNTGAGSRSKIQPQPSPHIKLLCPPTPERTPAWAHLRSNSLIATKLLAACPAQVLDGLSSLESSLLEDDISFTDEIDRPARSIATMFPAVDEEMEDIDSIDSGKLGGTPSSVLMKDLSDQIKAKKSCFNGTLKEGLIIDSNESGNTINETTISRQPSKDTFYTPFGQKSSRKTLQGDSEEDEAGCIVSFNNFDNLGLLGSGAFGDVYKARSRYDGSLYAIKRNRRQFRGIRDRDRAMEEVRIMQRLQSTCASKVGDGALSAKGKNSYCLYLLFFIRAWQEGGYFFCQTELCCRHTCGDLLLSLGSNWKSASKKFPSLLRNLPPDADGDSGRLLPEPTVWKICHDLVAGLSYIHSHGMVHHDIKPSNIFFIPHSRLGVMCKIGDFGMAGDIGVVEDGQEGDTTYMPSELLSSASKHTSNDMFSLGLTLYELASNPKWTPPIEGVKWHAIRSGSHIPELPTGRCKQLLELVQSLIKPEREKRPSADSILESCENIREAGTAHDRFLGNYIKDVHEYDSLKEKKIARAEEEALQRRFTPTAHVLRKHSSDESSPDMFWSVRTPPPTSTPKNT